ncbi:hypothetical protein, partial [Peribacillus frigoritolerans]|nr:hypothetical protein [Peribacillus castrilensis]MEC0299384.1 hypothetical protein [Peribacillus castrilensis]
RKNAPIMGTTIVRRKNVAIMSITIIVVSRKNAMLTLDVICHGIGSLLTGSTLIPYLSKYFF